VIAFAGVTSVPDASPTIGLVVPFAHDEVPVEGLKMYPGVAFVSKGVGVRSLTPDGYAAAADAIVPAAEQLARRGADAIMVIGTSLTFYQGYDAHEALIERLRAATGLPVSTMSAAVVEGLRALGARRIAVATAYADEVNARLRDFLTRADFTVASLEAFGLTEFGGPGRKSAAEIVDLGLAACAAAGAPEGLLISCGGLLTLPCAAPIEARTSVPVVSSTQAAFWSALRLAGLDARLEGYGRMLSL
jgi:arylmalonate decarboxylase